ncbi:MAG TPA: porin PorA family protein [Streptosporangiaceae bacterium]|nr:porin PorA family protein [Streptosporangiaceae bacterium]
MRKAAVACGVIGLVLLICGGLLAWWITPSYIARLPGNYNKTRTYDGTIHALFNPAALATGDLAAAIRTNLPATLTDNVKVLQTSGNSALVQDTRVIKASGSPVATTVQHYSLDRTTLEATASHPSSWVVTPAKGLTVSWPLGAKKQTYTGWVPLTETTTPVRYVGESQQGGITTYEYRASVPPTRIRNTQVLAALPKSLPASLVARLTAAGVISPSEAAGLATAFPGATSIPLGYTYQASNTYFVAPATGLVVNVANNETETGGILMPTGTITPVIPVLSDSYHASPASLSAAVSDANSGSNTITAWGVAVPIALAVVGFLLVLLAIFLWLRKRSRGRPVDVDHGQRHPSPAGHVR